VCFREKRSNGGGGQGGGLREMRDKVCSCSERKGGKGYGGRGVASGITKREDTNSMIGGDRR